MSERHGYSYTLLYKRWLEMRQRCSNKNNQRYKNYGGRGISVCDEWLDSAPIFIEWALDNGWKKGLCIDRINNDGNYEPDNCRFVTQKQSSYNKQVLQANNTTGYRGVFLCKDCKKESYKVQIVINNKNKYLGFFTSPVLAALRYDAEAYLLNDGRPRNFF